MSTPTGKKMTITAAALLLCTAGIAVFDFFYFSYPVIKHPPLAITRTLYGHDGNILHIHYRNRILCHPISPGTLDDTMIYRITQNLSGTTAVPRSGMAKISPMRARIDLSIRAARLSVDAAGRFPHRLAQRMRDIKNALLFALLMNNDQLLCGILNRVTVYGHIHGAQTASRIFFQKYIDRISQQEMTDLLTFLFNRGRLDPERRRRWKALAHRNLIQEQKPTIGADAIDYCLARAEKFPADRSHRIYTTIDIQRQARLERIAREYFVNRTTMSPDIKKKVRLLPPLQASAVIIDTRSGELRAMLGSSTAPSRRHLNRAAYSRRQISSTFKPFLYAEAIERLGLHPASTIEDRVVELKNRDGSVWRPKNFYPYFLGTVTIQKALAISINTVSVQLLQRLGAAQVAAQARRFFSLGNNDINRRVHSEPSLALGSIDLTPLELAKGYLVLARGGTDIEPIAIRRIVDEAGNVIADFTPDRAGGERLLSANTCSIITDILTNVFQPSGTAGEFFGKNLGFDIAGKSGSSPNDSWLAGYNPETLICTWAGFDRPVTRPDHKLPLFTVIPFWIMCMEHERPVHKRFSVPPELERKTFCISRGCLPTAGCQRAAGLFPIGTAIPRCPKQ